jgi:ectoine hydroxylase-related dioxygenase (phytanoyl-CoA dioxygenase family)
MMDGGYFDIADCDLDAFRQLTGQTLAPGQLRFASGVAKNVPVYDMPGLGAALTEPAQRQALLAEWGFVLGQSAGVLVLKGAYEDTAPIDAATRAYEAIIAREKARSGGGADHFAAAGANDRIWNALQKLGEEDPACFALYFGNAAVAAVCEAWLGPGYQMTAQVNLVRPGGQAQMAHRDYHLGFQTAEVAARFPAHVHDLSAVMTLQGAVAHCDMPVESGPTKLLPFSQLFRPGYMAYRREDFRAYFEDHHVQLPLAKGDAVFFNPALFHAAGENRSADIQRMANLLQVSSAFGRAMEAVDRSGLCRRLYPVLRRLRSEGQLDGPRLAAAITACAEGYSFPTNLDRDPPVGGLAPETQAALVHRALSEDMAPATFEAALDAMDARRHA